MDEISGTPKSKYQIMAERVKNLSSADTRRIFSILDDMQDHEAIEIQNIYLVEFGLTIGEFCTFYVLRDYVTN